MSAAANIVAAGPAHGYERAMVDGHEALIVDGLFEADRILEIFQFLAEKFVYYRGQLSAGADGYPKMVAHLVDLEQVARFSFYDRILETVRAACGGRVPVLYKAYVNQTAFGDMNYPHVDAKPGREDLTVLYYANPQWTREWGGATTLYEAESGFDRSVLPRPGRVLIFRGSTWHCAGIPSRVCTVSRFTLALKYRLRSREA